MPIQKKESISGDISLSPRFIRHVCNDLLPSLEIHKKPGKVIILGGMPGTGKSTLLDISRQDMMARMGKPVYNFDPDDVNLNDIPDYIEEIADSPRGKELMMQIRASSVTKDTRIGDASRARDIKLGMHILFMSVAAILSAQGNTVIYQRPWSSWEGLQNTLDVWKKHYPWLPVQLVYLTGNEDQLHERIKMREEMGGQEAMPLYTLKQYMDNVTKVIANLREESDLPLLILDVEELPIYDVMTRVLEVMHT